MVSYKHKDCRNFNLGWCMLKDKQVNADDPACDQFQPR